MELDKTQVDAVHKPNGVITTSTGDRMKQRQLLMVSAVASLLTIVLAVAALGVRAATRPTGVIELSVTELDFGTVGNIEPVSRVLQLQNVGQGWLEITGLSTSCGCTSAEVGSYKLAPREVTALTVTYDPQVHNGETGDFVRLVYIRSNDPTTPEASLTIRVTVVEP